MVPLLAKFYTEQDPVVEGQLAEGRRLLENHARGSSAHVNAVMETVFKFYVPLKAKVEEDDVARSMEIIKSAKLFP